MLAGTALYVCLMVYVGLSLFIIKWALCVYGCMHPGFTYAKGVPAHRLKTV